MKQNNYLWMILIYLFALHYSRQRLFKMYFSHTTVSYRTNRSHNGDNARNQTYLSCGAQSCLNTDSRESIKIQMICRIFFMVVLFWAKKSFCIPLLLDFFTYGLMKHPQLLVLFPIYVHRFLFNNVRCELLER